MKIYEEKNMKAGEEYLVEVHGYIMCKGLDSGKYKIRLSDYKNQLTATFFRPRGNKPIIRHYLYDLLISNDEEQNNRTQIIQKIS